MTPEAQALVELPKVKLDGERQRYTVMAHNDRFFIMTKPFNAQKTYLYTIADLERDVRGPCNLIFGLPCDVNTPEGASEALVKIAVLCSKRTKAITGVPPDAAECHRLRCDAFSERA